MSLYSLNKPFSLLLNNRRFVQLSLRPHQQKHPSTTLHGKDGTEPGFLRTERLEITPKSPNLVRSEQKILFLNVCDSLGCFYTATRWTFRCLGLGFFAEEKYLLAPYCPEVDLDDWLQASSGSQFPKGLSLAALCSSCLSGSLQRKRPVLARPLPVPQRLEGHGM